MSASNALRVGQIVYLSDPAVSRILRLTGFSYPESNGRWTVSKLASINLKLAPESVETGRLRLHMVPFVTEEKGQTLRLRCGEGPEQVVEFSPGTLAWRIVDLPLTGVEADGHAQIQLEVGQTFVPAKLGIGPEPRALGVMVRKIEILGNTKDLVPLASGASICLSSPDSERMARLAGFREPDPDGRWTDSTVATIELNLAPESVETGRLRLHMIPFVTEEKGQTLRLRCGAGPEQVVEFSPGTLAWRIVDLPLTGVEADGHAQIRLEVGQTFVPAKLGISTDPRALGVMVQKIELLSETEHDRVDEQVGEQPKELPTSQSMRETPPHPSGSGQTRTGSVSSFIVWSSPLASLASPVLHGGLSTR